MKTKRLGEVVAAAKQLLSDNANEAETRLQVVDDFLLLLGWSKSDFSPEDRTPFGDYTDYVLGDSKVIVEAKRVGKTFSLPTNWSGRRYQLIKLLNQGGRDLKDAINQAVSYCNQKGFPYAVVTNGHQWLIFRGLALVGIGFAEQQAIFFNGPEEIQANFIELESFLNKDNVMAGSLKKEFDEPIVAPDFARRPNSSVSSTKRVSPSFDTDAVRILFDYYLDEIVREDDKDMLEHCFVDDTDLHEYEKVMQDLLKERTLVLEEETQDLNLQNLERHLDTVNLSPRAKVTLVVGRVGAGKTTFLNRIFRNLESSGYPKFIVDLNPQAQAVTVPSDEECTRLSQEILENISENLAKNPSFGTEYDPTHHNTLRSMFRTQIERLRNGSEAKIFENDKDYFEREVGKHLKELSQDSYKFLPQYIRFISQRKEKPFCLIFDNVDQASDEYQKFVYTFARHVARSMEGVVMISMRDSTYWRAKKEGFLDTTISDVVFHVKPPNFKQVVSKRLRYYARHRKWEQEVQDFLVENKKNQEALQEFKKTPKNRAPRRMRRYLENLSDYAEFLKSMLLSDTESALKLVTCLGNRSIRKSLDILKTYGKSPFAWKLDGENDYHSHLLKCLMLGKRGVFFEELSQISNIFKVPHDMVSSHFVACGILAVLSLRHENRSSLLDSIKFKELVQELGTLSLPLEAVRFSLQHLSSRELVEVFSPEGGLRRKNLRKEDVEGPDLVDITPAGYYYLSELAKNESYQVYCAGDTVWLDRSVDQFVNEYNTAIELAEGSKESLMLESDCQKLWDSYLEQQLNADLARMENSPRPWHQRIKRTFSSLVKTDSPSATVPPTRSHDLSAETSLKGSKYLARVLWTLAKAKELALPPLTAAEIAKYVCTHTDVRIEQTNTARFFRECRKSGKFEDYWIVSNGSRRRYQISDKGESLLADR